MDQVKEAFKKVKEDIKNLKEEINLLKKSISDLISSQEKEKLSLKNPTNDSINSTYPTHFSTDNTPYKSLNPQNFGVSIGNEGVPTDRQTDRQTDQQTKKEPFKDAFEILNSLDSIKKEIRNKFKRITDQEFLIFSTIYQFSEEREHVDYKTLSQKLNLTESSIRDYVGRLIKKGISINKTKINNKKIQLSVSEDLRKITSLQTILQLREL